MTDLDTIHAKYLLSIPSVRDRSSILFKKILNKDNNNDTSSSSSSILTNFIVDFSKVDDVVDFIVSLINRDYGTNYSSIPPHGRWQHFNVGDIDRITPLVNSWKSNNNTNDNNNNIDSIEITKRLLDLFVVSVLLDAGAGNKWKYIEKSESESNSESNSYSRSEGIAVASLVMFKSGIFSNSPNLNPFQVNGTALSLLSVEDLANGMQATNFKSNNNISGGDNDNNTNPMDGLEGRAALISRLGKALLQNSKYFGPPETCRPGNILDYLLNHPTTIKTTTTKDDEITTTTIKLETLWDALMDALSPVWPSGRTQLGGISLGDAWICSSMPSTTNEEWEKITPFHKLTQWLCYSLIVPIKQFLGVKFDGEDLQTGLPEYRNGGLLVDFGVLKLKPNILEQGLELSKKINGSSGSGGDSAYSIPLFTPDSDVIIEWRALTVGFLDYLLPLVNKKLNTNLSLAQLLEAGTWKAGREIAAQKRPLTKGPPIDLLSDGTVF